MLENILVIVFGALAIIAIFGKFLIPLIIRGILFFIPKDTQKCPHCKGTMSSHLSYLFLLPCMIDDKHEESAAYYQRNMKPICDTSEIPSGQRACYVHVFQCESCAFKNVSIVDFLKVREQENLYGGGTFEYNDFRDILNAHTPVCDNPNTSCEK